MRVLLLLGLLVLVSCQADIPVWELKSMEEQCEGHGGIHSLGARFMVSAVCMDGTKVQPKRGDVR